MDDGDQAGSTGALLAHPVRVALAAVDAGIEELAAARLWSMTDHELLTARIEVEATRGRLEAAVLGMTREIDGRGAALRAGASSTAAWLRGRCRLRPAVAHGEVRLAVELDQDLPALAAALAAGQLCHESARVVADTIRALPAAVDAATRARGEAFLVEQARCFDAAAVATLGRHLADHLDPTGGAELERDEALREEAEGFTVAHDLHGSRRVSGRFTPEHGATLDAALDVLAAPKPGPDGSPDPRTPAKRRADALMLLVTWGLASEQMPTTGSEAVTITVITTAGHLQQVRDRDRNHPTEAPADEPADQPATEPAGETPEPLLDGDQQADEQLLRAGAFFEDGSPLSPESTRRLGCDGWLVAAIIDSAGALLDIGRRSRIVPAAMRRALIVRDSGCAFPGCGRPTAWCHAHHIVHWAHGGPTALHNLVLLCAHHHRSVHHDGWRVHLNPRGLPAFTPPRWIDPDQTPRPAWRPITRLRT